MFKFNFELDDFEDAGPSYQEPESDKAIAADNHGPGTSNRFTEHGLDDLVRVNPCV